MLYITTIPLPPTEDAEEKDARKTRENRRKVRDNFSFFFHHSHIVTHTFFRVSPLVSFSVQPSCARKLVYTSGSDDVDIDLVGTEGAEEVERWRKVSS